MYINKPLEGSIAVQVNDFSSVNNLLASHFGGRISTDAFARGEDSDLSLY